MSDQQIKRELREVLRQHAAGTLDETSALGQILVLTWDLYVADRRA